MYGEECKFGGGKTIREGMGQTTSTSFIDALDLLISNALIIDHSGIYKADIGVKGGQIYGIGKAGNPDVQAGVQENMVVGAATEVVAGEGLIVTAGAVDAHVHFICPQQITEGIASGNDTPNPLHCPLPMRMLYLLQARRHLLAGVQAHLPEHPRRRAPHRPSTCDTCWLLPIHSPPTFSSRARETMHIPRRWKISSRRARQDSSFMRSVVIFFFCVQ